MHKLNSQVLFPALVERISKEGNNESSVKRLNVFLLRAISFFILLSIISQLILGPLAYHTPAADLLINIGVFFAFGAAAFLLSFARIGVTLGNHLVALVYNLVFFYSAVRFYALIGPVLWTFTFILILISTARIAKTMLAYSGATIAASLIYLRFFANLIDDAAIIMPLILFAALYLIASVIYGINVRRLEMIDKQVRDLNAQIARRKEVEEENLRLAFYDHLTGFPNRLLFAANLREAIGSSKTGGSSLYVMFIDIDFFKRVNDTLGHALGDELIKQAGERINAVLGSSGPVCRSGGDEYLAMARDKGKKQVIGLANRVLGQFGKPFIIDKNQIVITCSIGIAKFPEDGEDVEDLIKSADLAMYKAKQDGKNRFEMYTPALKKDVMEEAAMLGALQDALANDEFVLYYQPQVDGTSKEIIGYEALIRWNHPQRGVLLPESFIPAAERSGLIVPVGEWAIRAACRQNKKWQDMGLPKVPVSVNISAVQAGSMSLYDFVSSVLNEAGLAPEYLEIEITESAIISNDKILFELEQIKSLGVKIAIDDFGTGYSAIQYLKNFPVDFIKIPMDFIHGININEKDESIINVIIALADSLKINVIAEGVETESQYVFLRERSCRKVQGFFFCKPLPADKVPAFCANGRD